MRYDGHDCRTKKSGSRKETGGLNKCICTRFPVRAFLETEFLVWLKQGNNQKIHFTQGPVNFCSLLVATHLVSQGQTQDIYTCLDGAS